MTARQRSYIETGFLFGATGPVPAGTALVSNGTGYVVATAANRTLYGRTEGISLTAGDDDDTAVEIQFAGVVDSTLTGLGTGSVSWVRIDDDGACERCTPSSTDDVVGKCNARGDLQFQAFVWDSVNYSGGSGATVVLTSEVTGTLPVANGGTGITSFGSGVATWLGTPSGANLASALTSALPTTKGGTGLTSLGSGLQLLRTNSGATAMEWWTVSISLTADVTGTLPVANGGTGITSLGSGVATMLGSFSSANIKSACTDETGSGGALVFATGPTLSAPVISTISNTGTLTLPTSTDTLVGRDTSDTLTNKAISGASNTLTVRIGSDVSGLGTGVATFLGTPSGANLASALTSALPDTKGGTGLTALGTGVATWLGTPSGANLASALTSSLTLAKGGLGTDASGFSGYVKVSAGAASAINVASAVETWLVTPSGANLASALTSALPDTKGGTGLTSLGSGVATFLGTPSGANLASALTSALPDTKGGTGLTALGTGVATFLGTPSGANLASALTTALPASKGGTGLTSLGTNVATWLGTPSSANLAAAITDETGSGLLVFNDSPTLAGTPVFSAVNLQATGNARGKMYSNISSVQTTDATVTSLYTWTILDEAVTLATAEAGADLSTGAQCAVYVRRIRFKCDGGTVTAGTVETTFTDETDSTWDFTIDNSSGTGRVRVTGKAASTIDWAAVTTRWEVSHA